MTPGTGSISNYGSYVKNCTLRQRPYKIPVNNLQDVQLYIAIGSMPDTVQYQLIHTCGPYAGTIETLTTSTYIIGQDYNFDWYGVFRELTGNAYPLNCFAIAVTLTFGISEQIYFSEEYCVESDCNDLTLIKGCYGNLDNRISFDSEGIYFGTHAGEGAPMGDATVVYKHQLLMRGVEVTLSSIKNTFKQGRTRNFRTEKEKIYQFWGEIIPEWYLPEIDSVFNRGEVYVGETRYLVNDTQFEKLEECYKTWKPTATFKESFYQSFSCEVDPCLPPEPTCCDVLGVGASVEFVEESGEESAHNLITIAFTGCEPTPDNGYNIQWRVAGTDDAYTDAGNFTESPAAFTDDTNPEGTNYEGIIRSDCGEVFGTEISWETNNEESPYEESGVEEGGGPFIVQGDGGTIFITDIQPVVYVGNAFPVSDGETWNTVHDGFSDALTVSVHNAFFVKRIKLYKNGILQQCITVPGGSIGDFTFNPVTFGLGDECKIRSESGSC